MHRFEQLFQRQGYQQHVFQHLLLSFKRGRRTLLSCNISLSTFVFQLSAGQTEKHITGQPNGYPINQQTSVRWTYSKLPNDGGITSPWGCSALLGLNFSVAKTVTLKISWVLLKTKFDFNPDDTTGTQGIWVWSAEVWSLHRHLLDLFKG